MRTLMALVVLGWSAWASAQESRFHADLRREATDLHDSCGSGFDPKALAGCVYTLATDDPFHVAFGSIAPQNGTAFGIAFAEHWTPNERWRIGWNADAVMSPNGSYRAGVYLKLVPTRTDAGGIVVRRPGDTSRPTPASGITVHEYPVLDVYAQTISLDTVPLVANGDVFTERQTIVGSSLVYPVTQLAALQPLKLALVGAINGRFVNTSSIVTALNQSSSFAEFQEGVRIRPSLLNNRLQLAYAGTVGQFVTSATSAGSFHRWTVDLQHRIPIYQTVSSTGPRTTNGPDDCGQALGQRCRSLALSRNREGSVGFRLLATRSIANQDSTVPFFFQPTLGGSDLNGERLLSAYDDYRFRGGNLFVLQESIEHSLWGPIGVYLLAEQGSLTPAGATLTTSDLVHSVGIGLTLRAGGFPLVNLTFAWGGGGHHLIGTIDPTLLGGSSRPSLY